MYKRYCIVFATILVLSIIVLSLACAKTTPPSSTLELKWNSSTPLDLPPMSGWVLLKDELEKRTNGRVKITFYPAQSLVKVGEEVGGVTSRLCDITGIPLKPFAKIWPITTIAELPSLRFPSTAEGMLAYNDAQEILYNEFPEIQAYYKDFKVVQFESVPEYNLHTKKQVRVPDDLKGVKIGTSGAQGELVKACGGAAIPVFLPDQYMALKTGQTEGTITGYSGLNSMKLWEVTKYHLELCLGRMGMLTVMNLDAWNELTPKEQKIFMELRSEAWEKSANDFIVKSEVGRKVVIDQGQTIIEPTDSEIALWTQKMELVEQKWLGDVKNAGVTNGEKMLARFKQLAAESWK